MNKQVIVIAPHPDDETLGCGGTILKHIAEGDQVNWLIVSEMKSEQGFSESSIEKRKNEINEVANSYGFIAVNSLKFPTTRLDDVSAVDLVDKIGRMFGEIQPEIVYVPYRGDVHSDHKHVFDAVVSCTKWFRFGSIKRVLAYETLSETDFGLDPAYVFRPNVFIDISRYLETKIKIMGIYSGELGEFPFPRSEQAMRALAEIRGAAAGCRAAEAFILLKEIL